MYFYKIVVFQLIQLLICAAEQSVSTYRDFLNGSEDESENQEILSEYIIPRDKYETELVDTVNEYYLLLMEQNDLLPTDSGIAKEKCGEFIYQTDITLMENTLYMVLKQMFNHYLKELPDKRAGLNDSDIEKKILTLFKSKYVETICSHMPRCLDFIYICTPKYDSFIKLLNLHSDLCLSRIEYLKQYDHMRHDTTNTEHKRVTTLYEHFLNKKKFKLYTKRIEPNDDEEFIKKIFDTINRIDKVEMIISSEWNDKTILCDYFNEFELKMYLQKSLFSKSNEKNPDIETLQLGLKKIVNDQGEGFLKKKTYNKLKESYENFDIDQLEGVVIELLNNVLQRVEVYFSKKVASDKTESVSVDQIAIINILSINVLDSFCKQVPLILYYLSGTETIDIRSFSSYLTLCSDWIYFLNVRCLCDKTENGEMLYNLQCVKQSVIDKILLNFYMIDQSTTNEEYFSEDVLEYKSFELIVQNIYTELYQFYESKDFFVVWPTFDWLSGVHLFTSYHSSDDMNKIKEHMLTIDDVKFPALQMYNQLLPWNLNVITLVGFKKISDDYILNKLDQYIWRQAKLIQLYFKHTKIEFVADEVFRRLNISTEWYRDVTSEMYKYFHLTQKELIISENVAIILMEIEKVNRDTVYDSITNALKLMDANYEINWSESDFLFQGTADLPAHLNKIFLNNCYDAINYANSFFSIVNKSNILNAKIENFDVKDLCFKNNIVEVFLPHVKLARKLSVNNEVVVQGKLKQQKNIL